LYNQAVHVIKNGLEQLKKIVVFASDEYLLRMCNLYFLTQHDPLMVNNLVVTETSSAEDISIARLLFNALTSSDSPVVLFTTYSFNEMQIDSAECIITIDPPSASAIVRCVDRALGTSTSKRISFITFSTTDSVDGTDYRRWFTDNRNKRHHNSVSSLAAVLATQ
jgi:hypothetical protein